MFYTNLTGDPESYRDISNRLDIVSTDPNALTAAVPENLNFKGTLDKITSSVTSSYELLNKIIDFLWGEENTLSDDKGSSSFRCMEENLRFVATMSEDIRSRLNAMADRLGMD